METIDAIIKFAQSVTPLGVIAILAIIIAQLVSGKPMAQFFGILKKPKPATTLIPEAPTADRMFSMLKTITENHFKHEIPDMINALDRLEKFNDRSEIKQDKMIELLTAINTKLK